MTLVVFLVSLGAILRLNRLAIDDGITQPVRDFFLREYVRGGARGRIGQFFHEMFSCPWCVGFWIACSVTALAALSGGAGWFFWPAVVLSLSWLAAIGHMGMYELEGEVHEHEDS